MKQRVNMKLLGKFRWVSLVLMLAILLCLVMPLSLQTASASARQFAKGAWQLVDYHQSACFSPRVTTSYYGIWIRGTWTRPINIGINNLPSGGSYTTSNAPIPPGSSTGEYSLAYVGVQLPTSTPVGTYTASLWASDSVTTRTVPVTLVVRARCGY